MGRGGNFISKNERSQQLRELGWMLSYQKIVRVASVLGKLGSLIAAYCGNGGNCSVMDTWVLLDAQTLFTLMPSDALRSAVTQTENSSYIFFPLTV